MKLDGSNSPQAPQTASPAPAAPERRRHGAYPSGFSLLELLIAVAASVVVVVAVFLLYNSFTASAAALREGRGAFAAAAMALDVVERDLACSVWPDTSGSSPFILLPPSASPHDSSALVFYTAMVPRTSSDDELSLPRIERVRYSVQSAAPEPGAGLVLARERDTPKSVTDAAGETLSDRLVHDVRKFAVEVFDGEKWRDRWPQADDGALPVGARVVLVVGRGDEERALETIVPIRAGQPRPSR